MVESVATRGDLPQARTFHRRVGDRVPLSGHPDAEIL
jgi:hypothetical protein